ncbi:hypothetical protein JTB14_012531 [Gonioctena quinquepunctata]|nr:hypothetical protein JTB14_012531 [Gonioctena quinquepunctata]
MQKPKITANAQSFGGKPSQSKSARIPPKPTSWIKDWKKQPAGSRGRPAPQVKRGTKKEGERNRGSKLPTREKGEERKRSPGRAHPHKVNGKVKKGLARNPLVLRPDQGGTNSPRRGGARPNFPGRKEDQATEGPPPIPNPPIFPKETPKPFSEIKLLNTPEGYEQYNSTILL